jgi:hypothetical protein
MSEPLQNLLLLMLPRTAATTWGRLGWDGWHIANESIGRGKKLHRKIANISTVLGVTQHSTTVTLMSLHACTFFAFTHVEDTQVRCQITFGIMC